MILLCFTGLYTELKFHNYMYVHFDKNYSLFISFQIKFLKLPYLWIYIFFNFKKYSVHKVSFSQLCFHSICELVIGKYKMGPIYNNLLYIYRNWNKYVRANFIWYRIFTSVFGWKYHYIQNNVLKTKTNHDWRHISGCNCHHSGAINWLALSSSKYL